MARPALTRIQTPVLHVCTCQQHLLGHNAAAIHSDLHGSLYIASLDAGDHTDDSICVSVSP